MILRRKMISLKTLILKFPETAKSEWKVRRIYEYSNYIEVIWYDENSKTLRISENTEK